ncbi:MAG TPA: serine hydrolase domain-containing protein [Vicinamibacterales bacterium]|jgi:CubicO group peptidase (beta-lactamase class C family)
MAGFDAARQILDKAVAERVFPAAAVEVGRTSGWVWREGLGRLDYSAQASPTTPDTLFDLASLTKVLATTTLAMTLVDSGAIDLDGPVNRWLPAWRGDGRDDVRVIDLLEHASGLPGVRPLYQSSSGRAAFEAAICREELEYPPRSRSVYSDLGFILLGFLVESAGGAALDEQFDGVLRNAGHAATVCGRPVPDAGSLDLTFHPRNEWLRRMAPTRSDPTTGRSRPGTVDDPNAAALGGVAGHAGLFGTAPAVGWCAREILGARLRRDGFAIAPPAIVERFTRRTTRVPGSSRALGWDTMLPASSCGTHMSPQAFGHTGFTGTSLWIDPVADIYVVLLTNRVHPEAGPGEPMTAVRRAFHDAVMNAVS